MNLLSSLIEKYPKLFHYEEDSYEPFALFGFECGDGWYDLISTACYCITSEYRSINDRLKYLKESLSDTEKYLNIVRGWYKDKTDKEIIEKLEEDYAACEKRAQEVELNLPRFVQIKEKFGTLRMYYDGGDEVTAAVTSFAEMMSAYTCEVCGCKGEVTRVGWHRTLCPTHTNSNK